MIFQVLKMTNYVSYADVWVVLADASFHYLNLILSLSTMRNTKKKRKK